MDSDQIQAICAPLVRGSHFLGVFPKDLMPLTFKIFPCCFIVNTDVSTKPGEHWIAYYVSAPKSVEFFDSFGHSPEYYNFKLAANLSNLRQLQSDDSDFCGHFAIYFLIQRSLHSPLQFIILRFSSYDLRHNDNSVRLFCAPFLSLSCARHVKFRQSSISQLSYHQRHPYQAFTAYTQFP